MVEEEEKERREREILDKAKSSIQGSSTTFGAWQGDGRIQDPQGRKVEVNWNCQEPMVLFVADHLHRLGSIPVISFRPPYYTPPHHTTTLTR
jgi:hypothetical protein